VGWDNTVWVMRDGIAFRFPRREIALAGVAREISGALHRLWVPGLDTLPLDPMARSDMTLRVPPCWPTAIATFGTLWSTRPAV
jgi:hypothetical protein